MRQFAAVARPNMTEPAALAASPSLAHVYGDTLPAQRMRRPIPAVASLYPAALGGTLSHAGAQ